LLFYGLLSGFLAFYLQAMDWRAIGSMHPDFRFLLLALPFSLSARMLQPIAWSGLVRDYGECPPPYAQMSHIYAKSWLGRYVPGKIAWIGGKVFFGSRYQMRKGVLALTSVIDAGIQLITGLTVAFVLLSVSGSGVLLPRALRVLAIFGFVLLTLSLTPPIFNRAARIAYRVFRRGQTPTGSRLSTGGLARTACVYLGVQILGTGVPFFLIKALHPALRATAYPFVGGATLIAGTLGTLAVFAPSGLGVREGILIVLLKAVVPTQAAVFAAVLMRLWSVAVDLLFYGTTAALNRMRSPPVGNAL